MEQTRTHTHTALLSNGAVYEPVNAGEHLCAGCVYLIEYLEVSWHLWLCAPVSLELYDRLTEMPLTKVNMAHS